MHLMPYLYTSFSAEEPYNNSSFVERALQLKAFSPPCVEICNIWTDRIWTCGVCAYRVCRINESCLMYTPANTHRCLRTCGQPRGRRTRRCRMRTLPPGSIMDAVRPFISGAHTHTLSHFLDRSLVRARSLSRSLSVPVSFSLSRSLSLSL